MANEITSEAQFEAAEKHEGPSRRAFLSGTGGAALVVAAAGLLSNDAVGQASSAPAVEKGGEKSAAPAKAPAPKAPKYPNKYPHLLSPIKIGNHVLKNRMIATTGTSPHLIVGPEACPNEAYMQHNANTARAGASIVILSQPINVHPTTEQDVLKIRAQNPNPVNPDHGTDAGHFTWWDLANAGAQNMLSQLTEAAHFYGSLCLWKAELRPPAGYDVSSGVAAGSGNSAAQEEQQGVKAQQGAGAASPNLNQDRQSVPGGGAPGSGPGGPGGPGGPKKELTVEMLHKLIEDATQQAVLGKECGFDGIWLHCGYRGSPGARMLSPLTNKRTDQYGGSYQNRARYIVEMCDAIHKRCGQDFLVMVMMSGEEPEGGFTLDDGAEFAKLLTGHADILDVKADGGSANAPDNFLTGATKRTPNLYMTEHYKKKGVTIPLLSDGGFTDLDLAEEAIASGKTDVVGMCRIFICNRDLITLAVEGRGEDVRPCIRCNACHGGNYFSPWTSTCFVNPMWGLEHKLERMISPPTEKKKVAVIGGGPAGMQAALIAAQRGHSVTLYEKTDALGGVFKTIENVSFKWPHKDFKDYLVRQVSKSGVRVRLNTEADPALIRKENYDAVLMAVGAESIVPDIPGVKGKNVVHATHVYGKEDALAKDVVVVGGGETGTETAMHLEEKGHNVTVLAETKMLAPDAMRVHFYEGLTASWKNHKNCKAIFEARCNGITENGVTYIDAGGKQQSIEAGSVVLAVGMKAKSDLALAFAGTSPWFYMIGDCYEAADLQRAIRSAFSIASTI